MVGIFGPHLSVRRRQQAPTKDNLRATSERQDAIPLSMQFAKDSFSYDRTQVNERFDWKMAVSFTIPRSTNAVTSATHRNAMDIGKLGTGRK
jgi:hypothetical protein